MPNVLIKAPADIRQMLADVKAANHPRLDQASVALAFQDGKPFIKDRINLGKVSKFSKSNQLWQADGHKFDFFICVCTDVWYGLLNQHQRLAMIDLHLTRCQPEFEPEVVLVNGKKEKIKDELGRTKYSNTMKCDEEGQVIWKVVPLDALVFADNIKRYGLWYEDLLNLKSAIEVHQEEFV